MAIQLEGVKDLTAKLLEIGAKAAARELRKIVGTAIEPVLHTARARIPVAVESHKTYRGRVVSPGFSQASLHVETRLNRRTGAAEARLGVSREAFYAVSFVELGTSKVPARPFLRPSFEEAEDSMLRAIRDEMRTRIEKIARKNARVDRKLSKLGI